MISIWGECERVQRDRGIRGITARVSQPYRGNRYQLVVRLASSGSLAFHESVRNALTGEGTEFKDPP